MTSILLAVVLLGVASTAGAQGMNDWNLVNPDTAPPVATVIPSGRATVYIEPLDGLDTCLRAALLAKHVPVNVVADREKADFVIAGTWHEGDPSWEKVLGYRGHTDDSAAAELVEVSSSHVIYTYAVNKKSTWHGEQKVAEAFAKHLDRWIEDAPWR
jgi:hypothetical protein